MPAPDPAPLPLDAPAEPRGRPLYGRQARLWALGDDCRAKLQERTAPRPARSEVGQDTLPGT